MPRIQPKWAIKLIIIEIHNRLTESLYNNKKTTLNWKVIYFDAYRKCVLMKIGAGPKEKEIKNGCNGSVTV